MNNYEIHFTVNGKAYVECVMTNNSAKARQLLIMRHPEAKITSVKEV